MRQAPLHYGGGYESVGRELVLVQYRSITFRGSILVPANVLVPITLRLPLYVFKPHQVHSPIHPIHPVGAQTALDGWIPVGASRY